MRGVHKKTGPRPDCCKATSRASPVGFTLIELLVVISIIALLLSILMPSLAKVKTAALRVKCAHNLKQAYLAINMYVMDHENTFPCAQDPLSGGYWLWMGRWRTFVEPYLNASIDANAPSVLLCPQDKTLKTSHEPFSYAYSMTFYHSPDQIDTMNSVEETYVPTLAQPSKPQRSSAVARPSAKILAGEWFSNHFPAPGDLGWWCWRGRRNYLFADGQVLYLDAEHLRAARDWLPDANLTIHGIKGIDYLP